MLFAARIKFPSAHFVWSGPAVAVVLLSVLITADAVQRPLVAVTVTFWFCVGGVSPGGVSVVVVAGPATIVPALVDQVTLISDTKPAVVLSHTAAGAVVMVGCAFTVKSKNGAEDSPAQPNAEFLAKR